MLTLRNCASTLQCPNNAGQARYYTITFIHFRLNQLRSIWCKYKVFIYRYKCKHRVVGEDGSGAGTIFRLVGTPDICW